MVGDSVTLEGHRENGEALVQAVMLNGEQIESRPTLEESRAYAASQLERLPPYLKRLENERAYRVRIAPPLEALADEASLMRRST